MISKSILGVAIWVLQTTFAVLEGQYSDMTLSDSDVHDGYLYSKATFINTKNSDKWTHDALEIINRNVMTQHTEMREDLQDRHQDMVNDVNEHITTVGNHLGEYINAIGEMILEHHKTLFEALGANATLPGDASWAPVEMVSNVSTPDRIYQQKNHNSQDIGIGDGGVHGSANESPDGQSWTVKGSGSDIWGNNDQFHYVNFGKAGNIIINLRVDSFDADQEWAKGGLMIRETLEPDSAHYSFFVTGNHGLRNVYRENTSSDTNSDWDSGMTTPIWLRIMKVGNQFSSAIKYEVADDWIQSGSTTTINFSSDDFYVGIAVTSQDTSNLATLTSSELKMFVLPPLEGEDIGDVGISGSANELADGSWAVKGSGSDIWGNNDQFYYANVGKAGDIIINLRVDSFDGAHNWAKGGLMIRETLETNSAHYSLFMTGSHGLQNVYRESTSFDSSQSGLYEFRTDLKGPKCPEGLEVSESECWAAGVEVFGGDNIARTSLNVNDWDFTPCGCFIWGYNEDNLVTYDRGEKGDCKVDDRVQGMVCKKYPTGATPVPTNPVWLQIKKVGNQFSFAYKYEVANDWIQSGSTTTINFSSDDFYVGIAVTSHDNSKLATLTASHLQMIAPNDESGRRRRLERPKPRFALDVQWPNGNFLDEIKLLKNAIGITAEDDDEGASGENQRANRRKIIGSRNVLEVDDDGRQSVDAIGVKVDGIEGKVDRIEADMKQMKDMMSALIEKMSEGGNVRT